jgi:hypothetical protein
MKPSPYKLSISLLNLYSFSKLLLHINVLSLQTNPVNPKLNGNLIIASGISDTFSYVLLVGDFLSLKGLAFGLYLDYY